MRLSPTPETLRAAMYRKIAANSSSSRMRRARSRSRAPRIRVTPRIREHVLDRMRDRAYGGARCVFVEFVGE